MTAYPCRHCGASLDSCVSALSADGASCCTGCDADVDNDVPSVVSHPPAQMCAGCRYWDPISPLVFAINNYGVPVDDAAIWGTCDREQSPLPPMFTVDANSYSSALRTQSTFSCSAHEPIEVAP